MRSPSGEEGRGVVVGRRSPAVSGDRVPAADALEIDGRRLPRPSRDDHDLRPSGEHGRLAFDAGEVGDLRERLRRAAARSRPPVATAAGANRANAQRPATSAATSDAPRAPATSAAIGHGGRTAAGWTRITALDLEHDARFADVAQPRSSGRARGSARSRLPESQAASPPAAPTSRRPASAPPPACR